MNAVTIKTPTERMIAAKDGAIGWMTFNNPERHNAVSVDMWQAIPGIVDAFETDPDVRVIVLKGAGERAFVAGADISQFESERSSPEAVANYERMNEDATRRIATAQKPTIAMIRGYCIGGGLGIALCTDLRIASDDARFAIPAAKLGLGYRAAGIKLLVDLVGPAHAKEIFFTARQFSAAEAHGMGLVNRVVSAAALEDSVRETADMIGANAPLTVGSVKRIVAELARAGDGYDRELCERLVQECFASEDYAEGRRAFMEKRKPVFKGR